MTVTDDSLDLVLDLRAPSDSPQVIRPRRPHWRAGYTALLAAADSLAALGACGTSFLARGSDVQLHLIAIRVSYLWLAPLSLALWLGALALSGAYRSFCLSVNLAGYRGPLLTGFRLMAATAVVSYAVHGDLSRAVVLVYFPTLVVGTIALRYIVKRSLTRMGRNGKAVIRLLLVGDDASVRNVAGHIHRGSGGYEVVGVCLPGQVGSFRCFDREVPVLGAPDAVADMAREVGADVVAVANWSVFSSASLQSLAWDLEETGIELLVAPDVADVAGPRIRVAPLSGLPLLHITKAPVDTWQRRMAAAVYRIAAVPVTLMLAPLLALIAVVILIDSGGPVFYRQERVGHRGRHFAMLKFRTMVPDAEERLPEILHLNEIDSVMFKIRKDPRVTRIGRLLRKYSLDEIPQIFNVLKGDMTVVGPRPVLPREAEEFRSTAEQRRFYTKPGITGLWQVSGRNEISWSEAVKLDLFYVENWSPLLDLSILIRTLGAVLGGTGY